MEFGVFAQLFVPQFERDRDPNAEHLRIFRNVEIAKAADQHGFKYVWCPQHHFPTSQPQQAELLSSARRIPIGSPRSAFVNITAGCEQAQRVAGTGAPRPPDEQRFEFAPGRLVVDRGARLTSSRSTPRMVLGRERSARSPKG